MKKFLFILLLSAVFAAIFPNPAHAVTCTGDTKECGTQCIGKNAVCLNLDYPTFGKIDLNLTINQNLGSLATYIYSAIVILSGLAAFIMLVWGGVEYMTSGAVGKVQAAKNRIGNALLGLLFVLTSFIIVQVVNPELIGFNSTLLGSGFSAPNPGATKNSADQGTPPQGSSGSPIAIRQCVGPGSFENASVSTLQDMGNFICKNNGGVTPTDAIIHSTLVDAVGTKNCNQNDVATIRNDLLKICGAPAGGVSGDIAINQSTVPVSFCSLVGGRTSGVVFDSIIKDTTSISFLPGFHRPEQAAPSINKNISAIITFCGIMSNTNPFCFLANTGKTRISSLDATQKNLLVQYCTDILPKKP